MFQIKTRNGKHGTYDEDECDSYWKAGIGICRDRFTAKDYADYLDKHGFYHKKGLQKKRLFELTTRCQRGLPSYQKFSSDDLQVFADSRGLTALTTGTASKRRAGLETLLEESDEQRTFPRFTELPPEIRMQVYQHYFASLDLPYVLGGPQPPPRLLVSHQVYAEARSTFFTHTRFPIVMSTAAGRGPFGFGSSAIRH
nr:hypothetical protein B0A51_13904 [Rachicladosporium sp. CCFEE 5018]